MRPPGAVRDARVAVQVEAAGTLYGIGCIAACRYSRTMARLARVVVSGVPHRVTQRGNRRQIVFFGDDDYRSYLALLKEHARSAGVATWAWCLMPNHVHLMLVPPTPDALRQMLSEAHRRYSRMVNFRQGWRGYLWQGRFTSCPLDEAHALAKLTVSSPT